MKIYNIVIFFLASACITSVLASDEDLSVDQFDTYKGNYKKSSPLQLSNSGTMAWGVLPGLQALSVTDLLSNSVVATLDLEGEPQSLAVSETGGYAYIALADKNGVVRIEYSEFSDSQNSLLVRKDLGVKGVIVTGAEPRAVVLDEIRSLLIVANSSQDTIALIDTHSNHVISTFDIASSQCNVGDRDRHFFPMGMAYSSDTGELLISRFLSYTSSTGLQRSDVGKEGIVCKLKVVGGYGQAPKVKFREVISIAPRMTGFFDSNGNETSAYPNQLFSINVRDGKAYIPNIAASPTGPQSFDTITQSFVNTVKLRKQGSRDYDAINLHLGGQEPPDNKEELYFANPVDIAFTTSTGEGKALVVSAGSDVVVELNVDTAGKLEFTHSDKSTNYFDLNDPDNGLTAGRFAGKNPIAISYSSATGRLYTLNQISRNISILDLSAGGVIGSIELAPLPSPESLEEVLLVGEEMFKSSRGYFESGAALIGSNRNRLSEKGRQNCESCHVGGMTDGVVWQFATGPRKTIAVNGTFSPTNHTDQRIINASAIFDEVEDADFNTRLVSSKGWLDSPLPCVDQSPYDEISESVVDPDHGLILGEWNIFGFAACVMNQFERPNANRPQPYVRLAGSSVLVKAHDALVDWQRFDIRTPNSPMTDEALRLAGIPSKRGWTELDRVRGREVFAEVGCITCHSGDQWTMSRKDFISPPDTHEIATESDVVGVNPFQYLHRFLVDVNSYSIGVPGAGKGIPGYREIGGEEVDGAGRLALGKDYNGDGKGDGYNVYSLLGIFGNGPYYHNGACETIECVLSDANHVGVAATSLNNSERGDLAQFVKSIDESTEPFVID